MPKFTETIKSSLTMDETHAHFAGEFGAARGAATSANKITQRGTPGATKEGKSASMRSAEAEAHSRQAVKLGTAQAHNTAAEAHRSAAEAHNKAANAHAGKARESRNSGMMGSAKVHQSLQSQHESIARAHERLARQHDNVNASRP